VLGQSCCLSLWEIHWQTYRKSLSSWTHLSLLIDLQQIISSDGQYFGPYWHRQNKLERHSHMDDWLFTVLRPAQESLSYIETSPLPVKGYTFRPMLSDHGLWAGRDLYRSTPAVTQDLDFSCLIRRTAPFSRLVRHTKQCGGTVLTTWMKASTKLLHCSFEAWMKKKFAACRMLCTLSKHILRSHLYISWIIFLVSPASHCKQLLIIVLK
jgi:hypothetical protein